MEFNSDVYENIGLYFFFFFFFFSKTCFESKLS